MNHFMEGSNRSYNFIAPLCTGLFYTHTNKNKSNAGVTRFIDLFQIVYLLNCVLVANIYFTVEAGKTNVSQYKNRLKFAVKRFEV